MVRGRWLSRLLYPIAVYLATPVVSAMLLWRGLRDRSYWRNFSERYGFGAGGLPHGVWLHAVSVGEVQACAPLVNALHRRHPQMPLTLTSFTPTGVARARALFGTLADVRYLPYDLPGAVRRFLARAAPRLAVIFETELWPNLYRECGRRGVPLVLASARLSPRSLIRYRLLGSLVRETLAQATAIAAQTSADADRFRALGADPVRVRVTGNLKFDVEVPCDIAARGALLRERYGRHRPVWVAGSTHGGIEEQTLLEAHRRIRERHRGALLVLAPRHPTRFAQVASDLEASGVRFLRHSQDVDGQAASACAVLLLDSLGELLDFYAAADVAFVGGSLADVGGHNLLEPAALAVPILTGPNNYNNVEVAQLLLARGAAEVVHDASGLAARLDVLLADAQLRARVGAAGRAVLEANRGALDALLALVEPLLADISTPDEPVAGARPARP